MNVEHEKNTVKARKTVLLSVRPEFARQILLGTKRVEFRRSWTRAEVGMIVIYMTAPVKRIIGFASVERVVEQSPTQLWTLAEELGGGVSQESLSQYLEGKDRAFGIVIKSVKRVERPIDPREMFSNFRAPQSYMFLTDQHRDAIRARVLSSDSAE